jgi:hypothetical protein
MSTEEDSLSHLVLGDESQARAFLTWVKELSQYHCRFISSWRAAIAAEGTQPAIFANALHSLEVDAESYTDVASLPLTTDAQRLFGNPVLNRFVPVLEDLVRCCRMVAQGVMQGLPPDLAGARWEDAYVLATAEIERAVRLLTAAGRKRGWKLDIERRVVTVDLQRMTITMDGITSDVGSEAALRWVKVLSDHPGEWISGSDIARYDLELDGCRTHRLKEYLPPKIAGLIDSETGKGSRISL